jgi:hypothetical protein
MSEALAHHSLPSNSSMKPFIPRNSALNSRRSAMASAV